MVDQELAALLDRYQDALMSIPGVVGVGLGQTGDGPVIQLFVQPSTDRNLVQRQVSALVGDAPVALVGMLPPDAQGP
jgi:hypothetical protein